MKNMKKFISTVLVAIAATTGAMAQSDFMLAEQLFSRIGINPAGTGNSTNVNIFSLNRFQYAGMTGEGAPFSTMLNVHSYFEKAKSGLGLTVSYDGSGIAYTQLQARIVYAYHVNFGKANLFSFGLGLGAANKMFDPSRHILEDESERGEAFPDSYQSKTYFDASFGIEYSNKYLMAGVSIAHIPGFFYAGDEYYSTLTYFPTYYGYVRGFIPCSEKFKLIPALSLYYTGSGTGDDFKNTDILSKIVWDANITGFISDYVWIGLGYRTQTTTYAMVGFEWKWLRIGYSCDLNLGKLNNISWTSHEVMLSFNIPTKKKSEWDD